jgi:hypothetical protein
MSIAAASQVEIGSESGATPYRCAAEGCLNYTADNFCAAHAVHCDECEGEWMAGDLKPMDGYRGPGRGMWCPDCVRAACAADRGEGARFLASPCYCGTHSAVRA